MGQKVNPCGFRVGPTLNKEWKSVLYAERDYATKVLEDMNIRMLIIKRYKAAQVSKIIIHRSSSSNLVVNIYTKKPGIIIGKTGVDIERLKKDLHKIVNCEIFINIHEVKKPALDSAITAQSVTQQLENRVSFRKAMKTAIQNSIKQGAQGIKISCSGRLGGAEIARTEWYREGRVPLHTIRADIDYFMSEAHTTYGVIGVKVWIYKGDYTQNKK